MWRVLRSPVATIRAIFFVQGLCMGGFFSRLGEMQLGMQASPVELGLALLGFDVGTFLMLPFASRILAAFGPRRTMLYGLPLFAVAAALPGLASSPYVFFVLAVFIAAGFTVCGIASNVEADRVEHAVGHRIMNSCHGLWSLGFFVSSLIGTGASALGIGPGVHLVSVAILTAIGTFAIVKPMQELPPRPHAGEERPPSFALPTLATLLIIAFVVGSIWLEAASRNWGVIYLRDVFHTANWIATLALPVYVGAQVIGRLLADGWIERFGPVRVAAVLSAISFVGLALVVAAWSLPLSLLGFVLIGFGVSSAFPQAMSAAARLGDRPAAENVAAIGLMNSIVLFLAPPVMGFAAGQWGIRASFALVLPLALLAIAMAGNLRERPQQALAAAD